MHSRKTLNILGERYGQLVVISEILPRSHTRKYKCKCDCGNFSDVWQTSLRNGTSQTCGHGVAEAATTHGGTYSPLYNHWRSMKGRCYTPTAGSYANYGVRGIIVCDEWKEYFIVFAAWANANGYKKGLSIDRIDGNGNYTPNNCRWVTTQIQGRNRKKRSNSSSQYTGVSFQSSRNKWIATAMGINGKRLNLGRFTNEVDAAKARDQYIIDNKLTGYNLNFP